MAGSAGITQLIVRQVLEANASADSFGNVADGHWYSSSSKDGPTALHNAVSTNCGAETLCELTKEKVGNCLYVD